MRRLTFVVVAPVLLALPLAAQPVPPPDDDCDSFRGIDDAPPPAPIPPPPPREEDAIAKPGFGSVFVVSPPPNAQNTPRNIEIRLGGDIAGLDAEAPHFIVDVIHDGERIAFTRTGARMTPVEPLPANQAFLVRIEATDANPCPECFFTQDLSFSTGAEIDLTPPVLDSLPPINVFVMPDPQQAAECGLFFGQTHQIIVDFSGGLPVNTFLAVTAKKEGSDPQPLFEIFNSGSTFPAQADLGRTLPVALGDAFFVAITPRDLAGNVGRAQVVRVRARSFIDLNKPREELAPLSCDMPGEPTVRVPEALPTNGQIVVEFPFEEVPIALRNGDEILPLVPVADVPNGHVYETAVPLPAGAAVDVVGLECPQCICEGCVDFEPQPIVIGDGADERAPQAPVIVDLREDVSPTLSVEEQCRPDRAALVVVIEPGVDDRAGPLELRYDATIRIGDGPPLILGRSLEPLERGDGRVALRVETGGLGRLLGDPFELTLDVVDGAGNRASATQQHVEEEPEGCAATGPSAPVFGIALAVLGLAGARRRRRA